jgi:hypothetical protein
MKKYSFILVFVFLLLGTSASAQIKSLIDKMPLVPPVPLFGDDDLYGMPVEERGDEYKKYLAPSIQIRASNSAGSGTIIYYDKKENIAYVATCGHLWNVGEMTYSQGKTRKMKCKVVTWYHNEIKLKHPLEYDADVLFYSYLKDCDTALIKFKPDWSPSFFPIAPKNYEYIKGKIVHSLGCDGAKEVAHYKVEIVGIRGNNLVTIQNSPRPGRSGGGLIDDKDFYIGTCWGTTSFDGGGQGFFTPLSVIHNNWTKNEFDWLLKINKRKIKIINRNTNKEEVYDDDYILMPNLDF